MLPAFDEQRVARIFGVVEERVVAQPLAGRVAASTTTYSRGAERLSAARRPCAARPAIASGGQGSVIECRSSR